MLNELGMRSLVNGPIPISPDGEPVMGRRQAFAIVAVVLCAGCGRYGYTTAPGSKDNMGGRNAISLYRMNPDGSQLEMLYGQESHDTGTNGETVQFLQPREMEDGRIMAIVRPFTDTLGGGDLIIIDTPIYLENTQATRDNVGMAGPAQ